MELKNERILWIDFSKVIGMYLVIMGHAHCTFWGIGNYYSIFFMPMFFIISGYLEKERSLKDTVHHGIKRLMIPFILLYFAYTILYVISGIIIRPEIINDPLKIIKPFLGILIGENGVTVQGAYFACGPLWFVLALFWIKIANSILNIICRNNIIYYCLLTFLAPFVILILKVFDINLLFSVDSATLLFPFYAIGKIAKKYSIIKEKTIKENIIIAFILFIVLFFTYRINLGIDVNHVIFGDNIFIFYILATIGSFATINLSIAIYRKEIPLIALISKGMIVILAAHWYFTETIVILGINIESIVIKLIMPLVILLVCVIPVIIANKYFPIILGGRK
jgi:fucose 4-O-acetylase-like acetyltransferase